MKTIRQYAEDVKQAAGVALGAYELAQPAPDKAAWLKQFIGTLPPGALAQFPFFQNNDEIATFVLAAGPVLEQVAPVPAPVV